MSIVVAVNHKTHYQYDRPVFPNPHLIRLRPAAHTRSPILGYSLKVRPDGHYLHWQQDPFNNWVARMNFEKGRSVRELYFEVDLVIEYTNINPFDFRVEAAAESYPFTYEATLAKELTPYREVGLASTGPLLSALVDEVWARDLSTIDHVVNVNRAVNARLGKGYTTRLEPGIRSPEDTLQLGGGSCRDFAWLMVLLYRRLGYAARFVSGYSIQLQPDLADPGFRLDRDVVDLHAWVEVYLPGAGWIGMDATSGMACTGGHIPLAATADPGQAAPITGSYAWTKRPGLEHDHVTEKFDFSVSVSRLREAPRVTKPYTEEQWLAIDKLGHEIDAKLNAADVRLTMGGEPTFVSIDDMDSPEWNIDALGPTKRAMAGDLLRRLHNRFSAGKGLLFFGQGKWYPGESLPRWSLSCWWRRDGVPIWEDPALVADDRRDYGVGPLDARRFVTELGRRLNVDTNNAIPGYEDAWYYLYRERRLPTNVDPLASNLDDKEERTRIAKIFDQGLGRVIGYTLPLRRLIGPFAGTRAGWVSGRWFLRREHLFLIPGDSPMGYRLPLDSLPWEPTEQRESYGEPDPMAPREPLPFPAREGGAIPRRGPFGPFGQDEGVAPPTRQSPLGSGRRGPLTLGSGPESEWESLEAPNYAGRTDPYAADVIRSALCVEPRLGRLHIFMPPVRVLEDYLDLVAAIEETARTLAIPVQLEGYEPYKDPRVNHFRITPDPGVIEVNIHPAHSWQELSTNTGIIYHEAREVRLGTEKYQLDGRHTGTGGGNHVLLGGATTADSPILRRPDLLASLVTYWNNHPSLSYIFSPLFIGPTSQHPRIDEARHDSLYEMELAMRQLPDPTRTPGGRGVAVPPWLTDRLFRHLLIDVTGNTHRAEFCIDKLFSPDGPGGRLGLLEFRAFEMPPHPRMSLAQQLLLRAAVARFWQTPYRRPMVRWGSELHDRFMLPHFVRQDFRDVIGEFAEAGLPLRPEWFEPHWEFRFPRIGELRSRDVGVELRTAIEPWHVLGEEINATGSSRYVDSSVERLQVRVEAMTDERHIVTCNGRRVPLHPTGRNGEFVAGVRYRAWRPPSALHPTIPIHTPLVLDLLDTWSGRSVGGATYHVMHPDGRNPTTFPVNAYEAEARRRARFFEFGHTPGPMEPPPPERNDEFPFTLDLRR